MSENQVTVPETLVEKVETEVKDVVTAVESKADAVVVDVKKFATASRVELVAEDKLVIRDLEVEYLRAQAEITRLEKVMKNVESRFVPVVQSFVSKYLINPATHQFNNLELAFVALEKKL